MSRYPTGARTTRRGLIALVAAAALALSGCGSTGSQSPVSGASAAPQGTPVHGGTLKLNTPLAPSTLDPVLGNSGGDYPSLLPIYDRLINVNQKAEPIPGLALSWKYPNPTTLVLELRSGVKFTDGTAFDADAVKFNLDRARTDAKSSVRTDLGMIGSVEVTGPLEVTIKLSRPSTALPLVLSDRAGMMASPKALQADASGFSRAPVGTGPFKVQAYAPGSSLTLKANPDYWQKGKPYLDGIDITYLSDGQTAVNSLTGGQTDFANVVGVQYLGPLQANNALTVSSVPTVSFDALIFNYDAAGFKNADARRAVQMAIDTTALEKAVYFGNGEPATQYYPKSNWAYQPDLAKSKYDVAEAKKLAESSGLAGRTIHALTYNSPGQDAKLQIIQAQLKAIGVNLDITVEEVSAVVTDFYQAKKFDVLLAQWSGRPDPSQVYTFTLSPKSTFNVGGFQPAGVDVDALIAAGETSTSLSDRRAAYKPLVEMMQQQAFGWLPLVFAPSINVMSSRVHGFVPSGLNKTDVSFVWLDKK